MRPELGVIVPHRTVNPPRAASQCSARVISDVHALFSPRPASSPRFRTPTTRATLSAAPRPATSVCAAP